MEWPHKTLCNYYSHRMTVTKRKNLTHQNQTTGQPRTQIPALYGSSTPVPKSSDLSQEESASETSHQPASESTSTAPYSAQLTCLNVDLTDHTHSHEVNHQAASPQTLL